MSIEIESENRTLQVLEWPTIVEELVKRCVTDPGKGKAEKLTGLARKQAQEQMGKISDLKQMISQDRSPDFSGIVYIEPLITRAGKDAILTLEELIKIRDFTRASASIIRLLKENKGEFPAIGSELQRLDPLKEITELLGSSITDTGDLSERIYPDLKKLRNQERAVKNELEKGLQNLVNDPAMAGTVQDRVVTTRNGRYVILVKSSMKGNVKGTVHDISASGGTLYIEPEKFIALNTQALSLEREMESEISRILKSLTGSVNRNSGLLLGNLEILSYIDLLSAAAQLSTDIRGSEPKLVKEHILVLRDARHPMLELMEPGSAVANDIELGRDFRCLILSGANTGGKTVLLKTIGLCALMASLGLHIPAGPDSQVGIFQEIMADIGDDQSLSQSLSTFSGQIAIISEMLRKAGAESLVIIDEIVVGTNPRQGAALAQSILESLIDTGACIVITTHYAELKELATRDDRFQNASVSFDIESLLPTYRLMTGLPGVSYANEIAQNYGLPERIISRSRSLLDSREVTMEALIERVQKFNQEMEEERARLDEIRRELESKKKLFDDKLMKLEKRAEQIKQKEGIEFLEILKDYREAVSEKIAGLQQSGLAEAGRIQEELIDIEQSIGTELESRKDRLYLDSYEPVDLKTLGQGDRVFILSLEREATVERVDRDRQECVILLGNAITSTIPAKDLYRPRGAKKVKKKKATPKRTRGKTGAEPVPLTVQTQYNTVDLRGKRVEEALRIMERDFDRMMRDSIGTAIVIHGHGTGALKEAVRGNLKFSPYVVDFRPGETGEGGDGVTVVRIKV